MDFFDKETIDEHINRFLNYVYDEGLNSYQQYVDIMDDYLHSQVLSKVTKDDYVSIFDEDNILNFRKTRKSNTVQAVIKKFLVYLFEKEKKIEKTEYYELERRINKVYSNLKSTDNSNYVPEFLSKEEIEFVLSENIEYKNDEDKLIATCIYGLAFYCGFEQKHLMELRVSDFAIKQRMIRNVRKNNENPYLVQWLLLNDWLYNKLNCYLEYRKLYFQGNSNTLFIYRNQEINNTSINLIFDILKRKDNTKYLKAKVSTSVLARSMILHSLISTEGKSLGEILKYQEWNQQIQYAHQRYLKAVELLYENRNFSYKANLHELLKDYENIREAIINDTIEDVSIENSKFTLHAGELGKIIEYENVLNYSEEYDINMDDLINFESNKKMDITINKIHIQRIVRNSKIAKLLKENYNHSCQLCGLQLRSSTGGYISEAHHIRPFNREHRGDDASRNMIVLCPNCHTQFDDLFFAINPDDLLVNCLFEDDLFHKRQLKFAKGHVLGSEYLRYTWDLFLDKKSK